MSWHLPPAVGSCRRGRRLPAENVARHRFAFSVVACCPWSAASPPRSRRWAKCSAAETWTKKYPLGSLGLETTPAAVSVQSPLVFHSVLPFCQATNTLTYKDLSAIDMRKIGSNAVFPSLPAGLSRGWEPKVDMELKHLSKRPGAAC